MEEKLHVVVSVLDEAIDTESMEIGQMEKYLETRDVKHLKFKPGKQPTRYYCREVRQSVWESYVMATESESERYRRAFQCGVVRVTNLRQRNGTILDDLAPAGVPGPNGPMAAAMPESELERFSASDRAEIGLVIFDRSFLAPRTVAAYRLPPTLPRLLAAREFRLADASQGAQAPSSASASQAGAVPSAVSEQTATAPAVADSSCASPTAATATGPWPAEGSTPP